jgi:hypothetical protein
LKVEHGGNKKKKKFLVPRKKKNSSSILSHMQNKLTVELQGRPCGWFAAKQVLSQILFSGPFLML